MRVRTVLFVVVCCCAATVFAQRSVGISVPCDQLSPRDCATYSYVFQTLGAYLFGEGRFVSVDLPANRDLRAPSDTAAVVQFLIVPTPHEDGSVWGKWRLERAQGGFVTSDFVLRPTYRDGAPWLLVDVTGLPHVLHFFGLTDDVKPRGGYPISGTTKLFAHLAVPLP